jgi:hypothetical protein
LPVGIVRRAWHANGHAPQLTRARNKYWVVVLFREANLRWVAIFACTRLNNSRVTMAGIVATAIH